MERNITAAECMEGYTAQGQLSKWTESEPCQRLDPVQTDSTINPAKYFWQEFRKDHCHHWHWFWLGNQVIRENPRWNYFFWFFYFSERIQKNFFINKISILGLLESWGNFKSCMLINQKRGKPLKLLWILILQLFTSEPKEHKLKVQISKSWSRLAVPQVQTANCWTVYPSPALQCFIHHEFWTNAKEEKLLPYFNKTWSRQEKWE